MSRDDVASALDVLSPLIVCVLSVFVARASHWVAAHARDRRLALAFELVAYGTAAQVAELQHDVVDALKDPSRPGTWDDVAAGAVKSRAVGAVKRLYPDAVDVIARAGRSPEQIDAILAAEVERAVAQAKAAARVAGPPAAPPKRA